MGLSKLVGLEFTSGKIRPEDLAKLIEMIKKGELSSRGAKDVLVIMFESEGEPETLANKKGLIQKNDTEEIKRIAEKVIKNNSLVVEEYKKGKESRLQFLIGQGMKESKGSLNPEILKNIIINLIK